MKKYVVFAALCTAMVACNSSDSTKGGEKPADNATPASTASAHEKGLEMIGALDCTTCHKISEKNIGPAYTDVAKKYEAIRRPRQRIGNKYKNKRQARCFVGVFFFCRR